METKWVNYSVKSDVLIAAYKDDLVIGLSEAQEMLAERLSFQAGEIYPIIIHVNGLKTSSKDARLYMGKQGVEGISQGAFIVKNTIEKVIINFFLSVEKLPVPARAFTNEKDALKWINTNR